MKILAHLTLAALCALGLSGCFVSEAPLIQESESVAPIAPGKYVVVEEDAGEEPSSEDIGIITVDGGRTIVADADAKPEDEPEIYLMRKVRGPYYIMMELEAGSEAPDSYLYSLVRVDGSGFVSFDPSRSCQALETLAASSGVDISSFGVVRVEPGTKDADERFGLDSCYFSRFEDLGRAFLAILDAALFVPQSVVKKVD